MTRVLVTGGAGFISSNLCRHLLHATDHEVVIMDALTYAGNMANIADVLDHERLPFVEGDIRDAAHVEEVVAGRRRDRQRRRRVARREVDRGRRARVRDDQRRGHAGAARRRAPPPGGALRPHLLERGLRHRRARLPWTRSTRSTRARRTPPPRPAATASCTPTGARTTCRPWSCGPFNNYGPYQHPEKVIPRFITAALQDRAADRARRRLARAATGCTSRTPREAIAAGDRAPRSSDVAGRGAQRRHRRRRRRARASPSGSATASASRAR